MKTHESKTYELRNIEHCSYAFITLTDLWENAGMLSIVSDYGSWNYLWGSMGSDIRNFLSHTGVGYLMDKLTYDKRSDAEYFNERKTLHEIKRKIIDYRADDTISKELAREAWDEAVDLFDERTFDTPNEYATVVMETCNALWKVFDFEDMPLVKEYSPSIKAFFEHVWPIFIEEIKGKLE